MKRKIFAGLFSMIMILCLAGCGKSMREQGLSGGGGGGGSYDSGTSADDLRKAEEDFVLPASPSEDPDVQPDGEPPLEWSTGNLPKAVIQSRSYYEFDYDKNAELFRGKTDGVVLAEESKSQYPALYDRLLSDWRDSSAAADANASTLIEESRNYYDESKESGFGPFVYEDNSRINLTRVDTQVFSYALSTNSFTGGAHGYYGNSGRTYDTQTGEPLSLTDVVSDIETCRDIVCGRILEDYPEVADFAGEQAFRDIVSSEFIDETVNWELEPDGIVFFFNPYDLASYADGEQIIKVTYADAPGIFVSKYLPESYNNNSISSVPNNQYILTDLEGDGVPERISVEPYYDQDYYDEDTYQYFMFGAEIVMPDGSRTRVGGEEQYDNFFFEYQTRVIRWANGTTWIMVNGSMEDGYTLFYTYDITSGTPKLLNKQQVYPKNASGMLSENDVATYDLTDLYSLAITWRYDRLCTFFAGGDAQISPDDGSFMLFDDYVYISEEISPYFVITSKMAFDSDIVSETGDVLQENVNFPAGTDFTLYRTSFDPSNDGATVDATLADGRIVRMYYSENADSRMVNGIDENDLFEQLLYAG